MPRGRLNEQTVQQVALDWLTKNVQEDPNVVAVTSGQEARLRKRSRKYWGRAPGLIAARLRDGSTRTVRMEAKSTRTLHSVSPQ